MKLQKIAPVFKAPGQSIIAPPPLQKTIEVSQESSLLAADIPKDITFDLPEGKYHARITDIRPKVRQSRRGPQNWVRFLFDVAVPGLSERCDTRAGRDFQLNFSRGSDLRNWLTDFVGEKFFTDHSGQRVNLEPLIGMECEVTLNHFLGDDYKQPLVVVASIRPVKSQGGID